jgi:hexokinase
MCKEIKAPEVEGTKVCESLNNKIVELGGNAKKITLLNDSTATLLAGVVNSKSPNSGFIGVILGTGCNSCYVENGFVYNVESGWYDSLPRGQFDDELDKDSINPGKYFLEKSTSGAYLGSLATLICKDLYSKGVIKTEVKQLSTTEINDFILGKSDFQNVEDKEIFYKIIERIILRSALFMAINLATLIIKTNLKGEVVYIVADGSTFHNLKDFKFTVENYLDEMLDSSYMYEIISVDNAPVIGAAVSCLLAN